ncbi:hypothetical protein F4560_004318 [Saccharothrix ecbatanensis]|uniref:Uncharacterized protein n=1 Tax=Saccharothrix ecbatanensis TaxID=1105145 RepID=A0A7W9M219_9PSEU|nr:hypothetical protein [Saccharothrix ecbatanensis]MBB5804550.1 hypothetical protein [Saccharothrix ecbatanensis]
MNAGPGLSWPLNTRALLADDHAGVGTGKPLIVAHLLADDTTATALEVDFLRYGLDLLDLYRGGLSFRRVCAVVAHLPDDAAVWRATGPDAGWTRPEILLAALERRVTLLWATVATALGTKIGDADVAAPLALGTATPVAQPRAEPEPETKSLREIALWMRGG